MLRDILEAFRTSLRANDHETSESEEFSLGAKDRDHMVMPSRDAKLGGAAGAGAAEGRRPTTVPAPAAAAPELSERPRRRTFSGQDKLRVLAEIDRAPAGGTGAILRREGLYSSGLSEWRRLRDAGALGGAKPIKRGPKPAARNPMAEELAQTKRENARLLRKLEHAEAIIAIQKKVAALLSLPMATADSDDAS
jgi:transposase